MAPPTLHSITNVRVEPLEAGDSVRVYSNWVVHQYNVRKAETDTRVWLDQTAQEPGKLQGAQFKAFIEAERARWKPFVEASGVAASR